MYLVLQLPWPSLCYVHTDRASLMGLLGVTLTGESEASLLWERMDLEWSGWFFFHVLEICEWCPSS